MESIRDLLQMRKNELDKNKLIVAKRLEKLKYKGTPKYHICVDSNKGQCYLKKDIFSANGKYARGSELRIVEQVANYE